MLKTDLLESMRSFAMVRNIILTGPKTGYRRHRADVCLLSRRIDCIAVSISTLNVDYFSPCDTPAGREHFVSTINSLKSGPIVLSEDGPSFGFRGLNFEFTKAAPCRISQDDYQSRTIPIDKGFSVELSHTPLMIDAWPRLRRAFVGGIFGFRRQDTILVS